MHTDVRDDNVLLRPDGTALYCDWNFPCRGAAWLDTLFMMVGPRGDGLDVEEVLGRRRLTRDLPAEHIDVVLALLTGYFWRQADEPVPPDVPLHPRPPTLAGRRDVGLALRAAGLVAVVGAS